MKKCPVCGFSNFDPNITCEKCGYQFSKDADLAPLNEIDFKENVAHYREQIVQKTKTYQSPLQKSPVSGLRTVAKVFMMISTVAVVAYFVLTLALWILALVAGSYIYQITIFALAACLMIFTIVCVSMTVHYFRAVYDRVNVGIGFKICTLLFVSWIAGILMLCDNDY